MTTPPRPPLPREKLTNRVHRTLAILALIVVVYLSATGIPLQFTDVLELGSRPVKSAWLHAHYGLQAPESVRTSGPVRDVDGQFLLPDNQPLSYTGTLIAAVEAQDLIWLALRDRVVLLDRAGTELAQFTFSGSVLGFGMTEDMRPAVRTARGLHLADLSSLTFAIETAVPVRWSEVENLQNPELAATQAYYLESLLSWERVFQDLHAGRFFGPVGRWSVTGGTLLLVLMAISGLILWARGRKIRKLLRAQAHIREE